MTKLALAIQTPFASALGWTIVHSLWQGAAAALALAATLLATRSPRVRYWTAYILMLATLGAFGYTFTRMAPEEVTAARAETYRGDGAHQGRQRIPARPRDEFRAADTLPWLAPFWIAGVLLFHLRMLTGWLAARRLRRRGVCLAPAPWQDRFTRLRLNLRVTRPVALLESCLAESPAVIGYLRPVILVPVGLFAGMPAGQIEAILLHELAHIKRHDYLANLLQTMVEGLLFYHPAVWWMSHVVRTERENCCDDLAVATRGDALEYASALAALEHNRWAANHAALAANGGYLMKRIRRILYPLEASRAALTPFFSAGILTLLAAFALTAWQTKPVNPEMKPVPQTAAYDLWLREDVAYIVTDQERAAFLALTANDEREHFIEQFWLRRDPTPNTEENEAKEEHYRRIAFANEHYASRSGIAGWKTDRGRTYIVYGPPDEMESHPAGGKYRHPVREGGAEVSAYPFEEWLYRQLHGVGDNVIILFVDQADTGEYPMSRDPHAKDIQ